MFIKYFLILNIEHEIRKCQYVMIIIVPFNL